MSTISILHQVLQAIEADLAINSTPDLRLTHDEWLELAAALADILRN